MAKIYNPQGRRRTKSEKKQQNNPNDGGTGWKETVGTHHVNGKPVFENKNDNRGFIFNITH